MGKNSAKTWGLIAGILVFAGVLISVINSFRFASFNIITIILWVINIFFAVSLFIDNIQMARIARILLIVSPVITVILSLSHFNSLLASLCSLASAVLLLLAFLRLGKQGQLFCFIALGLSVASQLTYAINSGYFGGMYSLVSILGYASTAVLSFYVLEKPKAPSASPIPQSSSPTAAVSVDTRSDIEKLTALKGLLDKGIISQEEFDAKKKQLLGM